MWKSFLESAGGAIKTAYDTVENEFEYRVNELEKLRDQTFGTAGPDSWERKTADTLQKAYDVSPLGRVEQGAVIAGGNTAPLIGLPKEVGEFVGGALAPGFAASKTIKSPSAVTKASTAVATNAAKLAVKETAQGIKAIDRGGPSGPALATAGVDLPQLKPDFNGGTVNLTPQVMEAVTINNPKVAKATGRRVGDEIIKTDPELAKHLVGRRAKIQQYENAIESAKEAKLQQKLSDNPDNRVIRQANQELSRNRPKLYSTQSNVKPFTIEDPQQYGTKTKMTMAEKAAWYKQRKAKGLAITEKIHEHHLVTKGGSAAAFRKMEEFVAAGKADMDDLVVMFEYAAKKNAATGDRLSNNAFILDTPHSELHQQVLKPAGDEFTQKQWNNILRNIKSPDDLMKWWVDQVDNNYVPNKKTGLIWQDLDDLIKEIQSK